MIKKTYYKTKDYVKVKFSADFEKAKTVGICGLNGDWKTPVKMKQKKDGSFTVEVQLPKDSRHEYKYLVNKNTWLNDPEGEAELPNEFGETNSFLTV